MYFYHDLRRILAFFFFFCIGFEMGSFSMTQEGFGFFCIGYEMAIWLGFFIIINLKTFFCLT